MNQVTLTAFTKLKGYAKQFNYAVQPGTAAAILTTLKSEGINSLDLLKELFERLKSEPIPKESFLEFLLKKTLYELLTNPNAERDQLFLMHWVCNNTKGRGDFRKDLRDYFLNMGVDWQFISDYITVSVKDIADYEVGFLLGAVKAFSYDIGKGLLDIDKSLAEIGKGLLDIGLGIIEVNKAFDQKSFKELIDLIKESSNVISNEKNKIRSQLNESVDRLFNPIEWGNDPSPITSLIKSIKDLLLSLLEYPLSKVNQISEQFLNTLSNFWAVLKIEDFFKFIPNRLKEIEEKQNKLLLSGYDFFYAGAVFGNDITNLVLSIYFILKSLRQLGKIQSSAAIFIADAKAIKNFILSKGSKFIEAIKGWGSNILPLELGQPGLIFSSPAATEVAFFELGIQKLARKGNPPHPPPFIEGKSGFSLSKLDALKEVLKDDLPQALTNNTPAPVNGPFYLLLKEIKKGAVYNVLGLAEFSNVLNDKNELFYLQRFDDNYQTELVRDCKDEDQCHCMDLYFGHLSTLLKTGVPASDPKANKYERYAAIFKKYIQQQWDSYLASFVNKENISENEEDGLIESGKRTRIIGRIKKRYNLPGYKEKGVFLKYFANGFNRIITIKIKRQLQQPPYPFHNIILLDETFDSLVKVNDKTPLKRLRLDGKLEAQLNSKWLKATVGDFLNKSRYDFLSEFYPDAIKDDHFKELDSFLKNNKATQEKYKQLIKLEEDALEYRKNKKLIDKLLQCEDAIEDIEDEIAEIIKDNERLLTNWGKVNLINRISKSRPDFLWIDLKIGEYINFDLLHKFKDAGQSDAFHWKGTEFGEYTMNALFQNGAKILPGLSKDIIYETDRKNFELLLIKIIGS